MQPWSRNAQFNRPISTQIHIAIVTLGCPKTAQWEINFLNQRHRRPLYAVAKALVDLGAICAIQDIVRPVLSSCGYAARTLRRRPDWTRERFAVTALQ